MFKFVPFAALASIVLCAPAQAQEISRVVSYADLDLTSEADVERLDRRIASAAREVCDFSSSTGRQLLSELMAINECGREAQANVADSRQTAIDRARGRVPTVEIAGIDSKLRITVRRR